MFEKQQCTPDGVCSLNSDSTRSTERDQKYGSGCSRPNRLINEKSPYLLQHAYNPVDWYPWGDEAFSRARELNLPILLSSGYSSCFWCHQLAHESFEDQEVADVLNRNFICIKVDREERPDIDTVYMMVCQAVTGGGGWPLTIFMTPDQKPFYAGTYFPKRGTKGRPGLIDIAEVISDAWQTNPKQLVDSAEDIIAAISNSVNKGRDKMTLSNVPVIKAKRLFEETYDEEWGGFGRSPKFPTPHNLIYLMEFYQQEDNDRALEMAENTLTRMYRGGIYDHIGGGFARYSTDEKWLAPHFEKMLYDNALLILAYLKAYKITNKVIYKRIVEETIEYVRREMTDEKGGFYAAQDASIDGEEGKFYVFTPDEISQVLGNDAGYFCMWFDITEKGNFEGKSIPNLITNHKYDEKERTLDEMRAKIYEYRKNRFSLHKDDKVLTAWNGLMIAALAAAGRVLDDERYLDMAVKAAVFIEDKLVGPDGSLKVRYRDGESAFEGTLDEYAYYIFGLLELYETAADRPEVDEYKDRAIELARYVIEHFWDDENKGFYLTGKDSEKLIFRPKESYDGAMPSGNSVMALNLQRLSRLMGKGQNGDIVRLKEYTEEQLEFLTAESMNYPAGFSCAMTALMKYLKNSN